MAEPFVITTDGIDYTWSPASSTPSARVAIAELPEIVALLQDRGATRVVDFGAGRGRNAQMLAESFGRVLLVEEDANVPYLTELVAGIDSQNITVQPWAEYRRNVSPKVDAILICFVIHTLPTAQMRLETIRTNVARLRPNGTIVFVTPRNDPKYRPDLLANAVQFRDGIVRLYRGTRSFSFYRNYTPDQFSRVIDNAGLRVNATLPSARRIILLTSQR